MITPPPPSNSNMHKLNSSHLNRASTGRLSLHYSVVCRNTDDGGERLDQKMSKKDGILRNIFAEILLKNMPPL